MQQIKVDTSGLIDGEIPDANDALAALIDLKLRLEDTLNGVQAFDLLNFGPPEALTISVGVVTLTKSHISLAGQGAAADDLDTINGGANGDYVIIRNSTDAYAITLKHGTGNLRTVNGLDVALNDSNYWTLGLHDGANWLLAAPGSIKVQERGSASTLASNKIKVPDRSLLDEGGGTRRLVYRPSFEAGSSFRVRAAPPDVQSEGAIIYTIPFGAGYEVVMDANGPFCALKASTAGMPAGAVISSTFDLARSAWTPYFTCVVKTPTDIDSLRYWIGLCSNAPANADNAGVAFVGFRFSTAAGDTGWRPVVHNGTTQNTGAPFASAMKTDTLYVLTFLLQSARARFWLNNGDEQILTSNLPAESLDLGVAVVVRSLMTAPKFLNFGRLEVLMPA